MLNMLKMNRWSICFRLVVFSFLLLETSASANDVPRVFYISKNDNGNQIHYGVKLDQNCLPMGNNPIYVYWVRENGTTGELQKLEQPAYGIYSQSVSGDHVDLILNFFQGRGISKLITVSSARLENGTCQAQAFTSINNRKSQLSIMDIDLTNIFRNPFTGSTIGGTVVNINLIGTKGKEVIPCTSGCRFGI